MVSLTPLVVGQFQLWARPASTVLMAASAAPGFAAPVITEDPLRPASAALAITANPMVTRCARLAASL